MLMKKYLLFAIAALMSVMAVAQKQRLVPLDQALQRTSITVAPVQKAVKSPAERTRHGVKAKAPELVTLPDEAVAETYYTASGAFYAAGSGSWIDATADMKTIQVAVVGTDIYIQGLAYWFPDGWIKGTIDGTTATFANGQLVGEDAEGPEYIVGSDDSETVSENIVFNFDAEAGVLEAETTYIFENEFEDEVSPYCFWDSPVFTRDEPAAPEPVVLPAGVELVEYALSYENSDGSPGSGTAAVAVDGDDVYFQGFSQYVPEALIKGEKVGNTVTFPTNQYLGSYDGMDSYLYAEAIFTYDPETGIYSSTDEVISVLGNLYYDARYFNPVLKPIVEQAAIPANPTITSLKNSSYGYVVNFNVPNVDVDGNGLVASKLSYIIYSDIEGVIEPLTFTPATHTRLTENMTEIPFGFSENYDFYTTSIYLNELYSSDWNNIGIQSIYRGGDEENATEIQWYHIKDYAADAFNPDDVDLPETIFNFNDGTMQGWTSIDANGDGYGWAITPSAVAGIDGTTAVYSESYRSGVGAITPDNYLVSPKLKLDGCITFYVAAQDADYPAEHFGVAVSTTGNESAADFETIQQWTLTAEGTAGAPRRVQGQWGVFSVDLRGYEGQEGYVAIRHFNCSDEFYIVVDNIAIKSSEIDLSALPDYAITPAEGELESISQFEITFPKFEVAIMDESDATAALYLNDNTEPVATAPLTVSGNTVTISFEEITEVGNYTLVVPDVLLNATTSEALGALSFNYVIPEADELVELPAGVEAEPWTIEGSYSDGQSISTDPMPAEVAFDGTDVYVKGIAYWFADAWIKGTLDPETNTVTFASGQLVGEDDYGKEFIVGSNDTETLCDIVFTYDEGAQTLTQVTTYVIENDGKTEVNPWGWWNDMVIYAGEPIVLEPVTAPADLEVETYTFTAVATDYYGDSFDYSIMVQVGFDGDDVYFQGLAEDVPELWVKGTKNEQGQYVIPANQYMGELSFWGYTFPYFWTAVDADGNLVDAVLDFDAETFTFTTDQTLALNADKKALDPNLTFDNVVITKFIELAATPANPTFEAFNISEQVGYTTIYASVPTTDVDGNAIDTNKLFYIIWIEKDGEQLPYVFTAELYSSDFDEDITEVPYLYDGYDLYRGGAIIYLEDELDVFPTWTKVGIQSVYYGGGERRTSDIIWSDGSSATGIHDVLTDNTDAKYFDLMGRNVSSATKGLLIKQYVDQNGRTKTVKVLRK